MYRDRQGLEVTGSVKSGEAIDRATQEYCAWKGDPIAILQEATASDPEFTLGHSAAATLCMLGNMRGDNPVVVKALQAADASVKRATAREVLHLRAAKAWAAGHYVLAATLWEDILVDSPRDLLALRFAHDAYFFLGHSNSIRDSIARVLPEWMPEDQNYGFVLGQYAFGLEETGDLSKAEEVALRAIDINKEDSWAVHALAHVLEMGSRQDEGIETMRSLRPNWLAGEWLVSHNAWHLQLYLLEQSRFGEVLSDYDEYIRTRIPKDAFYDLVDAAQILWRVELAGGDVGDRWAELSSQMKTHVDDHILAFNDLHVAMALAVTNDVIGIEQLKSSMERYAKEAMDEDRVLSTAVGRRLIEAVLAFSQQNYQRTIECILPIRHKVVSIGGSNAQRDIITQTLIIAAERAGNFRLARALLNERLAWRPTQQSRLHLARVSAAAP